MNTSPISSWENVGAYFTFGPSSAGMWVSIIIAAGIIGTLVIAIIRHERHSFMETVDLYPTLQQELKIGVFVQPGLTKIN
ncbi:hypothetical protein [Ammoniphilus sp. YIM 78166]|uniref:hypothetical protein n=1 Tax=Ammoniphilus sp. YIM 78166 TaxID=1644106 RepID=UPI00106F5286|nr:hypothetical protein [Ammoniphilus sp. YIM 78166]